MNIIDKIIEVARWAPSGANSQPWEFIVIQKQELRQKIIEIIREHDKLIRQMEFTRETGLRFRWSSGYVNAPVFIVVCGDVRTKDAYPLYDTLQRGSSIFTSSLASAFLYMTLTATTLGLGAQLVSDTAYYYVQTLTKDLLKIPKELEIYDMMALGYPNMTPKRKLMKGKSEIVLLNGF